MPDAVAPSLDLVWPEALQCLFKPKRYKVLYGGRGAGRSWGVARALLIDGLGGNQRNLCARELQASIKDSVHKLLADQITLMGMNYLYDVQQQGIYGLGQAKGTEFAFEGIRHNITKIKSYEGITRCWVEEADKLTRYSLDVLIPTIRATGSEIWFTFNPDQDEDEIYQRFVVNPDGLERVRTTQSVHAQGWVCKEYPQAYVVKATWRDNPWFPEVLRAEMEELKRRDLDAYLHVWEGHTRKVLEGAIFADELREAFAQDRITSVPYDRTVPVMAIFDLGHSDHTSIWFVQRVGFEWHVIDFYQNRLKLWDHYLKVLQQRGYVYLRLWLPHDAGAKQLGTGMSIQEQTRAAGYVCDPLVPRLSDLDKINAARTVFPNCYFDEKRCAEGLHALKHYQYEVRKVDPRTGQIALTSDKPKHDEHSHASDAFCYFGVASGLKVKGVSCKIAKPRSLMLGTLNALMPGMSDRRGEGWLGR
jgi:phage terminase large subunit